MLCQNCGQDHNGDYGSGRFCSSKCARGFSTKDKREEINKKVSLKLLRDPRGWTLEDLKKSLPIASSWKDLGKIMNISNKKINHAKKWALYLDLDYSHFHTRSQINLNRFNTSRLKDNLLRNRDDVFIENSEYSYMSVKRVLKQLYPERFKVCEECNTAAVWNNKPLTLQLDHINGKRSDNRLENLRVICPNCHSQTETFSGRNARINSGLIQ